MGIAPVAGLEIRREARVLDVGTIRATHVAAPGPSLCPLFSALARGAA
jgi:hypothetical protein